VSKRNRRILAASVGAPLLILILAALTLTVDGLRDEPGRADAAIVFGNKIEEDGRPCERLRARLDRALELLRQGQAGAIIVSGATGKEGFAEAEVMKNYLLAHGVAADRIVADNDGANSHLTALNAGRIMREHQWTSAVVVTQYFHVPRARLALKQCGISAVYTAHARYFEVRDLYSIPREVAGYVEYLIKY
jgi:vancomycin permeability regulator SanA